MITTAGNSAHKHFSSRCLRFVHSVFVAAVVSFVVFSFFIRCCFAVTLVLSQANMQRKITNTVLFLFFLSFCLLIHFSVSRFVFGQLFLIDVERQNKSQQSMLTYILFYFPPASAAAACLFLHFPFVRSVFFFGRCY